MLQYNAVPYWQQIKADHKQTAAKPTDFDIIIFSVCFVIFGTIS